MLYVKYVINYIIIPVCVLASGRDRAEDSQQAPADFHTGKYNPVKNFYRVAEN